MTTEALPNLYTPSNEQTTTNFQQELNDLNFKIDDKLENNLNKFYDILGKLASYVKSLDDKDKKENNIRSLPEHVSPLAMFSEIFKELITAIHTEFFRLKFCKREYRSPQCTKTVTKNIGGSAPAS